MTLPKPCITCGTLTNGESYCTDHTPQRIHKRKAKSPTEYGYDYAWRRLSERARKAQPFCTYCLTPNDLTTDHSEEAWIRKQEGKHIRWRDVIVLCRSCNSRKGRARPLPKAL